MKLYLCSPYSHPNPDVREARFESANKLAAELMQAGHIVFSPISHSHPIAHHIPNSACDCDFWLRQDRAFMEWCDCVVINTIDGWQESKGVLQEIEWAEKIGKPVIHLDPIAVN